MDTFQELFRPILYSFQILFAGAFPRVDADGFPFAAGTAEAKTAGKALLGGCRAAIWHIIGDREHYQKYCGHPAHNAHYPCLFCRATNQQGPDNVRNYQPDAHWKSTLVTPQEAGYGFKWQRAGGGCGGL